MRRPHTVQELTQQAKIPSSSYGYKMWIRSALLLFDQGIEYDLNGNLDAAFVTLLKGVTILLEIVPKAPELNKSDELYINARNKLESMLEKLEKLKLKIQERTEKFSSTKAYVLPPPSTSINSSKSSLSNLRQMVLDKFQNEHIITPEQLFDLLDKNNLKKVLVLDVRSLAEYLDGHISSKKCGIGVVDPDWLRVANNSSDLESSMTAFGPKDLGLKKVFQSRGEYEQVVYCDSSSTSLQNDLVQLHKIIYEWEFKVELLKHPKVLVGGFKGFFRFF
jgi:hypothetical protein